MGNIILCISASSRNLEWNIALQKDKHVIRVLAVLCFSANEGLDI